MSNILERLGDHGTNLVSAALNPADPALVVAAAGN
jgi:hypothetical protein